MRKLTPMKSLWLAAALFAGLPFAGCKKKPPESAPAPPAVEPAAAPEPPPADAPPPPDGQTAGPPAATLNEFIASPEYSDLNSLVEALYNKRKRLPTLAELTAANGRPLPVPPMGYKLVIDAGTKTVKAVPAK